MLTFKNNASFSSWITKINSTFLENAEDLDIAMPILNLLEYSDNYSMISARSWNYCWDKVNYDANEDYAAGNYRVNNRKTITSKSFKCKTKIIGSTPAYNKRLDTEVIAPFLLRIWLIQHLERWIDCFFFHTKMVTMILQKIIFMSIN